MPREREKSTAWFSSYGREHYTPFFDRQPAWDLNTLDDIKLAAGGDTRAPGLLEEFAQKWQTFGYIYLVHPISA